MLVIRFFFNPFRQIVPDDVPAELVAEDHEGAEGEGVEEAMPLDGHRAEQLVAYRHIRHHSRQQHVYHNTHIQNRIIHTFLQNRNPPRLANYNVRNLRPTHGYKVCCVRATLDILPIIVNPHAAISILH